MSTNERPSFYKRKLLIYPKFQLSLMAVNIVCMLAVFGAIEYQVYASIQDINTTSGNTSLFSEDFYNRFIEYQMSVIYSGLALYLGIGFVVSCFFTLFISHRLAGPLVRTQKYFEQMEQNGRIDHDLKFREGDFLTELPDAINRGLKSLQKQSTND